MKKTKQTLKNIKKDKIWKENQNHTIYLIKLFSLKLFSSMILHEAWVSISLSNGKKRQLIAKQAKQFVNE